MAIQVLNPIAAAALVNVVTDVKVSGYSIKWDPQLAGEKVQVYQSSTPTFANATLVRTVVDTYYDSPSLSVGSTYYVWVRRVGLYGEQGTLSGMFTVNITGVEIGPIYETNLLSQTGTASGTVSVGVSAAIGTVNGYNTWVDLFGSGITFSFTTPSGKGNVSGSLIVIVTTSGATGTSGLGYTLGRFVLIDNSTGLVVPGQTINHTFAVLSGNALVAEQKMFTLDVDLNYGFGARGLIENRAYTYKFQVMKKRTGSNTFNAEVNFTSAGAESSVTSF